MTCGRCGAEMGNPKYRDNGFRYFHCYECPKCGRRVEQERPHEEWEENQRAMRGLDRRDCDGINAQSGAAPTDPDYFNYGRGR